MDQCSIFFPSPCNNTCVIPQSKQCYLILSYLSLLAPVFGADEKTFHQGLRNCAAKPLRIWRVAVFKSERLGSFELSDGRREANLQSKRGSIKEPKNRMVSGRVSNQNGAWLSKTQEGGMNASESPFPSSSAFCSLDGRARRGALASASSLFTAQVQHFVSGLFWSQRVWVFSTTTPAILPKTIKASALPVPPQPHSNHGYERASLTWVVGFCLIVTNDHVAAKRDSYRSIAH